jgi:hypothetical protein
MSLRSPNLCDSEDRLQPAATPTLATMIRRFQRIKVEVVECSVRMDSLRDGDEGRSAGEMIGICLNEACNKKVRLLFQGLS